MKNNLPILIRASLIANVFSLIVIFPSASFAETSAALKASAMYFRYVEYDTDGSRIDKESGFLPGVELNFNSANHFFGTNIQAGISLYGNSIEYNGLSQSLTSNVTNPHQTTTAETLRKTYISFGITTGNKQYPLQLHERMAHTVWDRTIQPSNGVAGFYEVYEWNEAGIGINQRLFTQQHNQLNLTIDIYRVLSPTISVDFTPFGARKMQFALRKAPGYLIKLDWETHNDKSFNYGLSVFFEQYSFAASDEQTIIIPDPNNPTQTITIPFNEPHSETKQMGVQLSVGKVF